jgi:serine/threonine protein kinase
MEGSMVSEFKELFTGMVKYNPKERLRIGEVFQHPWMLGKKLRLTL